MNRLEHDTKLKEMQIILYTMEVLDNANMTDNIKQGNQTTLSTRKAGGNKK